MYKDLLVNRDSFRTAVIEAIAHHRLIRSGYRTEWVRDPDYADNDPAPGYICRLLTPDGQCVALDRAVDPGPDLKNSITFQLIIDYFDI